MGAEGAAQVANIYQAGLQQNAENMQRQAQMNFDVDLAKKQAEQNVQFRNVQAQRDLVESRLAGAQKASAQSRLNAQQGIQGMVGGLGMVAGDIVGLQSLDYKKMQKKYQKLIDSGATEDQANKIVFGQ